MTLDLLITVAEILVLLTIAGTVIFLTTRMPRNTSYRFAVGVAFLAVFLIVWITLAVGIIGEPENVANLLYIGVPAVGFTGAIIARFQPYGMARALFATALAQALVAAITVLTGLGTPPTPLLSYMILNGILIALWLGSAWLFWKASRQRLDVIRL